MGATLPGSLPGLLRRGAPVVVMSRTRGPFGQSEWPNRYLVLSLSKNSKRVKLANDGGMPQWHDNLATALLDLGDPASMDIAARWLAEKVGLRVENTAPHWWRDRFHDADEWSLGTRWDNGSARVVFASVQGPHWNPDVARNHLRVVPGISALTNPAEALALACLSLGAA